MKVGKVVGFSLAILIFSTSFIGPVASEQADVNMQEEIVITVDSTNLQFSPAEVTIDEGDTVRFFWSGELLAHNAVETNGIFDSGEPARNVDFSFTFDIGMNGSYEFVCEPHEQVNMIGIINVNSISVIENESDENETEVIEESGSPTSIYSVVVILVLIVAVIYVFRKIKKV